MNAGCVTRLLGEISKGNRNATDQLFTLVVDEMRNLARAQMYNQRSDHTLQPTSLVNEAVVRILAGNTLKLGRNRFEFFSLASASMRTVLVDHARRRSASIRPTGGGRKRVFLDEEIPELDSPDPVDLLAMDELMYELQQLSERHHEIVMLRFFGGLTLNEISEQLNVSISTVEKDWRFSRLWLRKRLQGNSSFE